MISEVTGFSVRNLPALLLVLALAIALLRCYATGLWAGIFHIFFPAVAAAHIGWDVNPFQFEVGMADLAIGITACIAFRRDLNFQAAVVCAAWIFLLGDAIGHVRQMTVAGNFAPGNAGVPRAIALVVAAKRSGRLRVLP